MSLDSVIQKMCYSLVDATALTAASLPFYATIEMFVGMPVVTSLETRAAFAVATYLGGGGIVGYFRDVSRKLFHVSDHTMEAMQHSHDRLYNAVCYFFQNLFFLEQQTGSAKYISHLNSFCWEQLL